MTLREAVAETYAALAREGLVTGRAGNVSALDAQTGTVYATPSGGRPGLPAAEVSVLRLDDASHLDGPPPSSELPTHLALLRGGAAAVIHTHAPHAVAFGLVADRLPPILLDQVVDLGGAVRVLPYVPTGTDAMGAALAEVQEAGIRGAVIRGHGTVTWGRDLDRALAAVHALDAAARAWLLARAAGGEPLRLPDDEVERLRRLHPS